MLFVFFPGWGNRLPYFINYFFDTYLLINEDTPVGKWGVPMGRGSAAAKSLMEEL